MSRLRTRRGRRARRSEGRAAGPLGLPAGPLTLSDDWRAWVVDNALRGVDRTSLIRTLAENGVPAHLARAEVEALLASPALPACARLQRRVEQLELVGRLLRTLGRFGPGEGAIERRATVTGEEFFRHYLAASRPAVLTGLTEGWPARARWSPAYFKERFGDLEVEIMADREGHPACDRHSEAHRRTTRMADFIDRLGAAGRSNDIYMVAQNRALQRTRLREVLEDLAPPGDLFDPQRIGGGVSLWIGPAGTVTPLHHDTTNNLFCQMVGRKRFWLVSPLEAALLEGARGFYAGVRAEEIRERPELAGVRVHEVELAAGEALFIPAGWWHEVTALDVSVSVSLLHFRRPNDFGWYRPGALG